MQAIQYAWREYLRNIGGRKNLRPGEEAAVKQAIRTATIQGGCRERRYALECIERVEASPPRSNAPLKVLTSTIISRAVTDVVGVPDAPIERKLKR